MLQKFATADILEARVHAKGTARIGHRHTFDYDPRPGYLYVRSRAISSRTNDNYDNFPAGEIKKGYLSFVGKPVFVNHHNDDHRRARGVILDAALHEDRNPDGSADTWVEVLMEVDATRFPKLTQAILAGEIERTSMGVDVEYSLCSVCAHKATTPLEYCKHIPKMKGMKVRRTTAAGGQEEVLVYEKCYGLAFFENSLLVEEPADPTAFFLDVDDRGLAMAASRKTAAEFSATLTTTQGTYRMSEDPDDVEEYGWVDQAEVYLNNSLVGQVRYPAGSNGQFSFRFEGVQGPPYQPPKTGRSNPPLGTSPDEVLRAFVSDYQWQVLALPGSAHALDSEWNAGRIVGRKTASELRENVVWQSENGTWNRGFFAGGWDGPDWDHFFWAKTGLPSQAAAERAWTGANPGGWRVQAWTPEDASYAAEYDQMAADLKASGDMWTGGSRKQAQDEPSQEPLPPGTKVRVKWNGMTGVVAPYGHTDTTVQVLMDDIMGASEWEWDEVEKIGRRKTALRWNDRYTVDIQGFEWPSSVVMVYRISVICDDHGELASTNASFSTHGSAQEAASRTVDGHERMLHTTTARRHRVATRRRGFGEVKAPVEVDTMRDEFCPVCGEADSFDGDTCRVCQYIKPPDEFLDPDLDKAKQIDLHQETQEVDEAVAEGVGIEDMPGDGEQEFDEDGNPIDADNPLAPDEELTPDEETFPADEEELPDEEDLQSPDEEDSDEDEDEEEDEDGENGKGKGGKPPWVKNKKKGATEYGQCQAPIYGQGQCPNDAVDEFGYCATHRPSDPRLLRDRARGDAIKNKKSRRQVREVTGGGPVMGPAMRMLISQQRRIRAQQRQIHALNAGLVSLARLAGVERHVTAVMKKAQDENPAQPEGWALPATPAAEPAAFTTEETLGDVSPDTVGGGATDEVTTPGATSETDAAPDAQTSVTDTGVVLDEPLDLEEQDVTAPVAGTDTLDQGARGEEGTNRTETEIRIGDPNAPEVAFAETGWTEAARSFASLRLARARIRAGIEKGDDLALGTAIAASKLSNKEIQTEIETLDKVVASRGQGQPQRQVRGNRAPRLAAAERNTPSLAPTPQVAYAPSEDEFLLEP